MINFLQPGVWVRVWARGSEYEPPYPPQPTFFYRTLRNSEGCSLVDGLSRSPCILQAASQSDDHSVNTFRLFNGTTGAFGLSLKYFDKALVPHSVAELLERDLDHYLLIKHEYGGMWNRVSAPE